VTLRDFLFGTRSRCLLCGPRPDRQREGRDPRQPGGISHYSPFTRGKTPGRICSSFHAGPGQQVFGCGPGQRCDVLLAFFNSENDDAVAVAKDDLHVSCEFYKILNGPQPFVCALALAGFDKKSIGKILNGH
jgi:hypothetical protein